MQVVAQEANPSVTAVLLLADDNVLATAGGRHLHVLLLRTSVNGIKQPSVPRVPAGAADEIVKLWDMRKLTKPAAQLIPERLRKPSARVGAQLRAVVVDHITTSKGMQQ